jgi:predicted nucleotidyltransferase
LFGSHASGTSKDDSVVDIAVFTDGLETPKMDLELGVFHEKRLKRPMDMVIMQKVSRFFSMRC